jgi:hypothetical protein
MSDLSFLEKAQLEKLFDMQGGYVLNFVDRSFQSFIADTVHRDIDDRKYFVGGTSKAKRLRAFWKIEPNAVVGLLVQKMTEYAESLDNADGKLVTVGYRIAARLKTSAPVPELDAIQALTDDRTFEALAKSVRDSIENNEPEHGLDRLHTFVVKYVRTICQDHGITVPNEKPLHSMFGEYVKYLRANDLFESDMTERILKSSISTLEAFNHVRKW